MSTTSFPVFGSDDDGDVRQTGELTARTPDGFRPLGQQRAVDNEHFHFVDRARETEDRERRTDDYFRQADPELFEAREILASKLRCKAEWAYRVTEAHFAASQAASLMNGTSADSAPGTRAERALELSRLREVLADVQAEYEAALEEVEAARSLVNSLVTGG